LAVVLRCFGILCNALPRPESMRARFGHVFLAVSAVGWANPATASDLRWALVGAGAVQPRPEGERLVYPEIYPGMALTIESRRRSLAYRFDLEHRTV